MKAVNHHGLIYIHSMLMEYHNKPETMCHEMLNTYAAMVEVSIMKNKEPHFQLNEADSKDGQQHTFQLNEQSFYEVQIS